MAPEYFGGGQHLKGRDEIFISTHDSDPQVTIAHELSHVIWARMSLELPKGGAEVTVGSRTLKIESDKQANELIAWAVGAELSPRRVIDIEVSNLDHAWAAGRATVDLGYHAVYSLFEMVAQGVQPMLPDDWKGTYRWQATNNCGVVDYTTITALNAMRIEELGASAKTPSPEPTLPTAFLQTALRGAQRSAAKQLVSLLYPVESQVDAWAWDAPAAEIPVVSEEPGR